MNRMNRTVRTALLLAAATLTLQAQTMLDRIVARVDKEIITESELNERVYFYAMQNRLDQTKPELKKQVLDAMISEKLVLAQAIIDSVFVTDEEVSRALDQQMQNIIRQAGSEQRVEQIYGKPVSRIKREFREEMRKQLMVQRIRQTREANLHVSRREVEEFYAAYKDSLPQVPDEFELSQIFIVPKADSTVEQQIRNRAQVVLDSIRAGGDFAEFAKRYSGDGTAANGGDLGWARRGDYVREFEEVVFALKENEISGIVKTQFGFHIIKLEARRGEQVHARHILFRLEKGAASDSAAVELLRGLKNRVLAGESFAALAKKYSEDEDSKALGGDLGKLTEDQLTPEFATAVKTMKEGEICEPRLMPLGASYGYQIVHLRKKYAAHPMNMENDFTRVESIALYMKRNRENTSWIDELKKTIFWENRFEQ